ncbi:division plane positioning ATPase MipZ [Roseimaritima ulvae]|uniref:CobQ/CobB/MinD/ParA nucleotide binding domain protein n=1 Tax=Roseimaritima ulvae TaxID=980254 RepID=A0A5B9QXJ1_9BACT|nr:division plane positioning ATPase MipZ [Roseimaritima ulvae]QEG43737.1 hypothetical protein UC8_57910 [Roseimaritima ulvae]
MSKIDKAFVKAFAKERPQASEPESASGAVDLAALGMSSFWIDPSSNDLMRMDAAQPQPLPKPPSGRRRGTRPLATRAAQTPPPPIPPAAEQSAAEDDTPEHYIKMLRIDAAQPAAPPEHVRRTRLDASAFPAITVTHDSLDTPSEVAEPAQPPAAVAAPAPVAPAPVAAAPVVAAPEPAAPVVAEPAPAEPVVAAPVVPAPVAVQTVAAPAEITEPPATATFPTAAEPSVAELPVEEPAATAAAPVPPFEAAWEVDEFETPAIIHELLTNGGMISGAGMPMAQAAQEGMQKVLITSPHRGAGRSTLAIGLALAAATTGIRVALVDGDWDHPTLVDDLQLDLEFGWPEAIRGGVALSETAVHSVGDGVTLFPIVPSSSALPPQTDELQQTVEQLTAHFDLIIVDGPSADMPMPPNCFQSGIIVRDLRSFDKAAIDASIAALRAAGIAQVGVAENFAS